MAVVSAAGVPKVISVAEAAQRLGVSDRTIRRWIREGRLKRYRLMGDPRRFVAVEDVEALREPFELPADDSPE